MQNNWIWPASRCKVCQNDPTCGHLVIWGRHYCGRYCEAILTLHCEEAVCNTNKISGIFNDISRIYISIVNIGLKK